VIAGYIHVNKLPLNRVPMFHEILKIAEFDNSHGRDYGIPYFLGKDDCQNEIYILGFGKERALGLQTIFHLLLEDPPSTEWKFLNALDQINWLTRIGGFLSQQLKLVYIGKNLAARGIQMTYFKIVKLVTAEKERYGNDET
jgi:hypothetical protein